MPNWLKAQQALAAWRKALDRMAAEETGSDAWLAAYNDEVEARERYREAKESDDPGDGVVDPDVTRDEHKQLAG